MRTILLAVLMLGGTAGAVQAQTAATAPVTDPHAAGREIVKELTTIVSPNGVQETYTAKIGGIDQWLYVRGQDKSNPILLFAHGGPASPLSPVMWTFQRPLEEYFTVVQYDQRGAGRTYRSNQPDSLNGELTIDRYVDDLIEVAEHVRKRYGKDKVILAGHSWGTILGMKASLRRPDLFHAYIGIGQIINQVENERLSVEFGLEQATKHGNEEALREINSIMPYPGNKPITRERIIIARKWPQYYGGLSAYREESRYFFRAPRLSPEYDKEDIASINQGSVFTLEKLLPQMLKVDFNEVKKFPIPVLMFMGRHDYTTPSAPPARWIEAVDAPFKKGIWFENSAHMIPLEEPGKTLVELLTHVRPLAMQGEK